MESLNSHPTTAQQAKHFISPTSLSMPGGAGDLTPPSEKDGSNQTNGMNGQQKSGANAKGTGVTPNTPAATPGAATTSASGIVPTLQ
jgi:transcription initiation factor TFIID TATA-box-binding protein